MRVRTGWAYPLLIIMILGAAVALRIADPVFLQALRSIAFDVYQQVEPAPRNPDSPVRIVAIDGESLDRIGPWPWPAEILAMLTERLTDEGSAAVAFNFLIDGPDEENALAAAMALVPSVMPVAPTNAPSDDVLPPVKANVVAEGEDPLPYLPAFGNIVTSTPGLDAAAAGIGFIDPRLITGLNGGQVPLIARMATDILPALSLEVLRLTEGAGTYTLSASSARDWTRLDQPLGLTEVAFGTVTIPVGSDGSLWVNLRPVDDADSVPAWKVLEGEPEAADLSGRIALIGLTEPSLAMVERAPLAWRLTGVAVQAQAMEHILSGRALARPAWATSAEIALAVGVALFLALLMPRIPLSLGVGVAVVFIGLILVAGWLLFRDFGLVLDPTWPALATWVIAALAALYLKRRIERRRAEIRLAFGHALAPAVVDSIMRRPQRLVLSGERRELTVLFCQIRNFAAISEAKEPRDLIAYINRLYAPVSRAILAERGTIAQNTGETVTAFWNAPLEDDGHATAACRAAARIALDARKLNEEQGRQAHGEGGFVWSAVGIGLATGNCTVGNLGGGQHFDYTAIGDDVGLARRLEGVSETYGVSVVVAEGTVERMHNPRLLELDLVRVKGRRRPIRIFTPTESVPLDAETAGRLLPVHEQLISRYRARDWQGAEVALQACREFRIDALATLYSLYRTRIATFREISPPPNWDGADATTIR